MLSLSITGTTGRNLVHASPQRYGVLKAHLPPSQTSGLRGFKQGSSGELAGTEPGYPSGRTPWHTTDAELASGSRSYWAVYMSIRSFDPRSDEGRRLQFLAGAMATAARLGLQEAIKTKPQPQCTLGLCRGSKS